MNRPLVWVGTGLAAGSYMAAGGMLPGIFVPLLICVVAFAISWGFRGRRLTAPISVAVVFLAAGALLWNVRHSGLPGDELSRFIARQVDADYVLTGTVREADIFSPDSRYAQFLLDVACLGDETEPMPISGGTAVRWYAPDRPLYPGERVRVTGTISLTLGRVNPGVQGIEDYFRRQGIHSALRAHGSGSVQTLASAPWWSVSHWTSRFRSFLAYRLSKAIPEDVWPFVRAVWLGDRVGLSEKEQQSYIDSGTVHILSVSGVHMGIVYVTLAFLLGGAVRSRRIRAMLVLAGVLFFAVMTGARVATLRAAIMVAFYIFAELLDREPDAPTALSASAILFTLVNPALLFDTGFQLSFLSMASILIYTDRLVAAFGFMPRVFRQAFATSVSVQILPWPWVVHLFHVWPIAAPLANLIVVPLLTGVLWLTFGASVLSLIASPAALLFGHALVPVVWLIQTLIQSMENIHGTHVYLTSPSLAALTAYWLAAAALTVAFTVGAGLARRWCFITGFVCIGLMIVFWRPFHQEAEVVFLDVGHGDSAFVRTPGGTTLLVDGGDANPLMNAGSKTVAPFLWANHVNRLDYIAVSHPDRDHIGGVLALLERFDVGEVALSGIVTDDPKEKALVLECQKRGIPVRRLKHGDEIPFAGATFETLYPSDGVETTSTNNASLVFRMSWPGMSVLFTGDIETDAEAALSRTDCSARVLKVPHHGSATSSTPGFIAAVSPSYAIVSTGGTYGREACDPLVLRQYEQRGCRVFRTDLSGAITVRSGAEVPKIIAERNARGYLPVN